jgi:predicted acetyltransferase
MEPFELRELEVGDEAALREAVRRFAETDPDWEFTFGLGDDTEFAGYVDRLRREQREVPEGWVPHTFLVGVAGGEILGRVSLRHELNDFLRDYGGHVGFGVVPRFRRRGYGTELLRRSLPLARGVGIERLLVTCADDNLGSIKIIESCGGVLEDKRARDGGGLTRRYWIDL